MAITPRTSKPLKVALVGAGMISWYHLTGWRSLGERVRVVAVCDPDPVKAAKRAEEFSIPHCYQDADALFAAEATDVLTWLRRAKRTPDGLKQPRRAASTCCARSP